MKTFLCEICLILLSAGNVWTQEENAVNVDVLAKTSVSWDGTPLPNYPTGKPEITILRIQIPPKVQLPLHEHPVINAGVLLIGINESNKSAEIIVFYAGVQGSPITIKK